jgi:transcription elongation factor S-II
MASEERKKADEEIKRQNLHDSLGAAEPEAETTAFQCSKCKQACTFIRDICPYLIAHHRENAAIARLRPEVPTNL